MSKYKREYAYVFENKLGHECPLGSGNNVMVVASNPNDARLWLVGVYGPAAFGWPIIEVIGKSQAA